MSMYRYVNATTRHLYCSIARILSMAAFPGGDDDGWKDCFMIGCRIESWECNWEMWTIFTARRHMGNAANMLLILGLVTPSYAKPNTKNVVYLALCTGQPYCHYIYCFDVIMLDLGPVWEKQRVGCRNTPCRVASSPLKASVHTHFNTSGSLV